MDREKFQQVIDYFKDKGVELPTSVKNSIEDAFMENDNIENVQCYYRNELDGFQRDLSLTKKVDIYTNGESSGNIYITFTYFGQVDFSVSEFVTLLKRDPETAMVDTIEEITKIDNTEIPSRVYDKNEYNVILVESLSWVSPDEPERHDQLFIYCPDLTAEEEEEYGEN